MGAYKSYTRYSPFYITLYDTCLHYYWRTCSYHYCTYNKYYCCSC